MQETFPEIVKAGEPLAPYTSLRIGGKAEYLVAPRTREELAAVARHCFARGIAVRVLGGGSNVLVRDEGVPGVVLRLCEPGFTTIEVEGKEVRAGAGAVLSALISAASRAGLAGLEGLVGIAGTVGGALRCNAGDRTIEIGQLVRSVEILDERGQVQVRERDELRFTHRSSNLDDPVILSGRFALEVDDASAIVKRMRKAWIQRKARQPLSFQAAARVFRNPRGLSAADLIEQAGLARARVGGAEVSDRNASWVVAASGTSSRDVLRLIDMVQSRVREQFNVDLELDVAVW